MSKILIVGHQQSGYRDVEYVLQLFGMKNANNSKKECLSPHEITAILQKAHKISAVQEANLEKNIIQISPSPVWNGLALDLMLGNIEQDIWGWADPQAIYLLDYWKVLDSDITFMLVYDEPHRLLADLVCYEEFSFTKADVQHRLSNWLVYNNALEDFYLKNRDRSVLVHAQQFYQNADSCVRKIQPYLNERLSFKKNSSENEVFQEIYSDCDVVSGDIRLQHNKNGFKTSFSRPAYANSFLIEKIFDANPEHIQCYEKLQSLATLPMENISRESIDSLDAWIFQVKKSYETNSIINFIDKSKQHIEQELGIIKKENINLLLSINELRDAQNILQEELLQKKHEILSITEKYSEHITATEKENQSLSVQITQLQQEFSRCYQSENKIKQLLEEKSGNKKRDELLYSENKLLKIKLKEQNRDYEKLNEKINNINTDKKRLLNENKLVLSQLNQVQNELEKLYVGKNNRSEKKKPEYYGAAERVKKHLSYRVGKVVVDRMNSFTGLISLPWALFKECKVFYKDKKEMLSKNFPPIHVYCDACEADEIKKMLPYRIGSVMVKNRSNIIGWIKIPFCVYREIKYKESSHQGC